MSVSVSEDDHEIEDLQVEVVRLLLDHVYAPLLEDQHVRGVLPSPLGAPAVRVALGAISSSRTSTGAGSARCLSGPDRSLGGGAHP
jgi:hypothetical protein